MDILGKKYTRLVWISLLLDKETLNSMFYFLSGYLGQYLESVRLTPGSEGKCIFISDGSKINESFPCYFSSENWTQLNLVCPEPEFGELSTPLSIGMTTHRARREITNFMSAEQFWSTSNIPEDTRSADNLDLELQNASQFDGKLCWEVWSEQSWEKLRCRRYFSAFSWKF